MERVSTGLDWLDSEIEKGYPKNKVTLIVGQSGTGKSNLGIQFLKEGLYNDERVGYFTAKESPQQIKENMHNLGWNLEWAFEQDRLKIIDIRDYFWSSSEEDFETGFLSNFFLEIDNIIKTNDMRRLVFDPVLPQTLFGVKNLYDRYFTELIQFLESKSLNATSLLISGDFLDQKTLQENIATNVIRMFYSRFNLEYKRTLFIQKMQNTYYQPKELFFDIIHKKGLVRID